MRNSKPNEKMQHLLRKLLGQNMARLLRAADRLVQESHPPHKAQEGILLHLLRKASGTAFGQHHRFKELTKLRGTELRKAFSESVPFHTYESMYREWWWRTVEEGEKDVCWKGEVKLFALSSGTSTGTSKYIPVTSDMLRCIRKAALRVATTVASRYPLHKDFWGTDVLILGSSTSLQPHRNHTYKGDISGMFTRQVPRWFSTFYRPGWEIASIRDWKTRIERIVEEAHRWNVGTVIGFPSWICLLFERLILHYKVQSITELWPQLSLFIHGGVSIKPYLADIERMAGRRLLLLDTYLASEGFFAFQDTPNARGMRLVLNNGVYFEFVPFNENTFDSDGQPTPQASKQAVFVGEVEEGKSYALVVSTCGGAWRYIIGDVVRFTDARYCEIEIVGRVKHFVNLCGEHLSVENLEEGIATVAALFRLSIPEFTLMPRRMGNHVEHWWFVGVRDVHTGGLPDHFCAELDRVLQSLNDDYRVCRNAGIVEVRCWCVPLWLFYEWMEAEGRLGGQNKFPRVLDTERGHRWKSFLADRGYGVGE